MLLGGSDGNHRDLSGLDRGVNLRPCHVFETIIRQHALDLVVVTVDVPNSYMSGREPIRHAAPRRWLDPRYPVRRPAL